MAKRPVPKYDFKAFGAAIKAAREGRKESRKKVGDEMFISPRYLANIENKGQHPSLQIFFELIQRYHIKEPDKEQIGEIEDKQLLDFRLHNSRPLSLFFTFSRCAFLPCAASLRLVSSFRIEGFLSCVSFFAENSLKAAVSTSASRPLKKTR